ncbi:MAG TPA: PGPGW domain-containing protein [Candidatus Binatia bacterium]|nr:PGPGW domain-containing protein [Candidatus Binatia bacterium]
MRIARLSIGSLLIVVGVIGGFIPVLQGWIFVLGGLSLLAQESDRARLLLERVRDRFQGPPRG